MKFEAPSKAKNWRDASCNSHAALVGICIFLVAITWVVFGQTLHHDFVNYDDDRYVYKNPEVRSGLAIHGIVWAFTHSHGSNWHPLTSISHMLDCQLFGLNAGGHHFSNVVLHTVAVVLLFLLLYDMTAASRIGAGIRDAGRNERPRLQSQRCLWRSAFVATVFAIHPLHVESVAWISERKDVLSAVFFMLTLGAYVRYVYRPSPGRYLIMAILFALGLMSKPMLVTVPIILLLLDYWPLNRIPNSRQLRRLIVEKIPLYALSAISCVATILAQRGTIASVEGLPLTVRVSNALVTYIAYIWQMIWPQRLAALYPYPEKHLLSWQVVLSIVLLGLITTGAIALRHKRPYLITGWFWYLIMLVPVIGLVQVGIQARADRYTYLPQIGLYLVVTWAVADAFGSWPNRKRILAPLAAAAIAAMAWSAWRQTSYWRNSESLWVHTLAVTSQNFIAHNNLGNFLLDHNRVDEAIAQFQMSAHIEPSYFDPQNSLGVALIAKGQTDEAIVHLQRALELRPNEAAQLKYVATYNSLGVALTAKGRFDEAISNFQKALGLSPNEAKTYYNLGNALLEKGEVDDAIANYQKALAIEPHYAYAHYNLGNALTRKGEVDAATVQYQKAVEDKPDNAEACSILGNDFLEMGWIDEAIALYQHALKIRPDYPKVQNKIGLALLQKGRPSEAIAHWQKILEVRPDFVDALNNLAWVLATFPEASIRNDAMAIKLAERALQLTGDSNPAILRTLAAAYANNGRFNEAINAAQRGLDRAKGEGNSALADIFEGDIALYQTSSPVRRAAQASNSPAP